MADNHKPEKPAVLYKYLPADRALEALPEDGNGALRATQPAALNDPFECATYCDTADPDKKEKSQEMARVLSKIIPGHPVYVDKVENSLGRIGSQSWNELFMELSCPPKLDPDLGVKLSSHLDNAVMNLLSNGTVSVPCGFHNQEQVNECPDENSA